MNERDPVEAVDEVLELLLNLFGDGERWLKGRFSDHRGKCCLVGALHFVRLIALWGGTTSRESIPADIGGRRGHLKLLSDIHQPII
jgi:hypothetical protein